MKIMSKNKWEELYEDEGYRGRYPNEDVIRFIQKNFSARNKRKNIRILEWGSGTGRHICYLAREGFLTFGVEIAASGIELTKKWLKKEGFSASLKKINGFETAYANDFFDAVIDCAAVQHNNLARIKKIILEMHRILKPGGRIFLFCKSKKDSLFGEGKNMGKDTFFIDNDFVEIPMIIHFFNEKEIRSLLKDFFDIKIEYTERTIEDMTRRVSHFIVTATKKFGSGV
jgi:SAM-dependent methyltransferase